MNKLKEIWNNVPEWYKISYWFCLLTSAVLLFLGFFSIPVGQIDPSVLTGTGILFAFASLGVGAKALEKGVATSIKHNNTELKIEGNKKENE